MEDKEYNKNTLEQINQLDKLIVKIKSNDKN